MLPGLASADRPSRPTASAPPPECFEPRAHGTAFGTDSFRVATAGHLAHRLGEQPVRPFAIFLPVGTLCRRDATDDRKATAEISQSSDLDSSPRQGSGRFASADR